MRLALLKGFELTADGIPIAIPLSAQRVATFLALQERPVLRGYVAGNLWPEASEGHAAGSLRSALWRLRRPGHELIEACADHLQLAPEVSVDVRESASLIRRLIETPSACPDHGLDSLSLVGELMPSWYDDWVLFERERLRQLRLHALEVLCERWSARGRYAQAVDAGLAAIRSEPLRETAHRVLMKAHLSEGNYAEALRQYRVYRQLLWDELGLQPSPLIESLAHAVRNQLPQ